MVEILEFFKWVLKAISTLRANAIIRQRGRDYLKNFKGKVIVYTAIFGGKDALQEVRPIPDVDYVCFTDDENLVSRSWKIVKVKGHYADPRKSAKFYKILPHRFFQEYEYSLWVDGTHVPVVDVRFLIHKFLAKDDIALFAHRRRKCVYQEMEACVDYNKANAVIVKQQENKYRSQGYPSNNGLAECTVILRRHNAPNVTKAMEDWWKEIEAYTLRDQLSFNYIAYRNNLSYALIPGDIHDNYYFKFTPHISPDISTLRVGWVLNRTPQTAGSGITECHIHDYLVSKKIYSKIFYNPSKRGTSEIVFSLDEIDDILNFNINILVIVKLNAGRNLDYLIRNCKWINLKIVYVVCDPPSQKMAHKADGIIATNDYFYKIIPKKYHQKLFMAFEGNDNENQGAAYLNILNRILKESPM